MKVINNLHWSDNQIMKSLKNYIAESTKVHIYHIKLAMEPSSVQVNAVESLLRAYQLVDFSNPSRIEDDKFDFFDIHNKDVYCIRIVTSTPISSYVLQQQLRDALDIPENYIVVRAINEPVEIEAEEQRFKQVAADEAKQKGFTFASMLDTNREYQKDENPSVVNVFGDEYNKNLLANLANIKADRKSMEFEPHMSLFSWIDMKKVEPQEPVQDTSDFNAHLNTTKPITSKNKKDTAIDDQFLGTEGNFDDGAVTNIVRYNDKGTKRITKTPRANKKLKG